MAVLIVLAVELTPNALGQRKLSQLCLESSDVFAKEFENGVTSKGVHVRFTDDLAQADYVARFDWETKEGLKKLGVLTGLAFGSYVDGSFERVSLCVMERRSGRVGLPLLMSENGIADTHRSHASQPTVWLGTGRPHSRNETGSGATGPCRHQF
jgi:hypothetical protein